MEGDKKLQDKVFTQSFEYWLLQQLGARNFLSTLIVDLAYEILTIYIVVRNFLYPFLRTQEWFKRAVDTWKQNERMDIFVLFKLHNITLSE